MKLPDKPQMRLQQARRWNKWRKRARRAANRAFLKQRQFRSGWLDYFSGAREPKMHVVTFSGGVTSWKAAKRVAERYGTKNLILLFADTRNEDPDTYRFLVEAAWNIGAPLRVIADGRTPIEVMKDEKFLANSRLDLCSRVLKRELIDRWITENCDRETTAVYGGIDWTEEHRYINLRNFRLQDGWYYYAPLCQEPFLWKADLLVELKQVHNIKPPRMYELGFSHNNCGGQCVKAGQGHMSRLLTKLPERYSELEEYEQQLIRITGKPVSILTDRTGDGKKKPLTLKDFRIRIEGGVQIDAFEEGGCGCASDVPDEAEDAEAA